MTILKDRVAIITGASRGIGRAVALKLASEGVKIVVAAKSEASSDKLPGSIHTVADEVRALGAEALPVRVDVRSDDDIAAMRDATLRAFGRIDFVINNAGALYWQNVLETPMKRFDLVMGVNVRAAFACTQMCLPHLLKSDHAHVLFFSPPVELAALPGKVAYLISKFGMTMMAHGLAEELRGSNVAANALWPATAIESFATINFGLGDKRHWRKADILADATVEILKTPAKELSGKALIDEDFLRTRGVSDFSQYRCDPDHEPPHIGLGALSDSHKK